MSGSVKRFSYDRQRFLPSNPLLPQFGSGCVDPKALSSHSIGINEAPVNPLPPQLQTVRILRVAAQQFNSLQFEEQCILLHQSSCHNNSKIVSRMIDTVL